MLWGTKLKYMECWQKLSTNISLNVTLSHLRWVRSKKFQRIQLPCIFQHRETSKFTLVYIEMYLRKVVVLLNKQATFIKARIALMWIKYLSLFYTSSDTNKSMLTWWIRALPKEALKWRNFGVLAVLKVRKCYWKVKISLTAHSQAFQHVLNADMPTLQATWVNHCIRKLTLLGLYYTLWLVFKQRKMIIFHKILPTLYWTFWDICSIGPFIITIIVTTLLAV